MVGLAPQSMAVDVIAAKINRLISLSRKRFCKRSILAKWRKHSKSSTSNTYKNIRNATMIRNMARVISIFKEENISGRVTDALVKRSKQNCAFFALCNADSLINDDDAYGAINQIREAVMLRPSFKVIRSAGRIILLDGSRWLRRNLIRKLRGNLQNQAHTKT